MRFGHVRWGYLLRVLVHLAALSPLVILAWDFLQGRLTANPIREIQLRTGRQVLLLLTLSLAGRPVYLFTGLPWVLGLRRTLGLYAFAYACLHLLNFAGLDYGFNLLLVWEDISEKRYIVVGFAAFLILATLAATSTRGWQRRLGENWGRLHRLVHLAGFLAVVHYAWQAKVAISQPLVYGVALVVLLALRIPAVRRLTGRRRS